MRILYQPAYLVTQIVLLMIIFLTPISSRAYDNSYYSIWGGWVEDGVYLRQTYLDYNFGTWHFFSEDKFWSADESVTGRERFSDWVNLIRFYSDMELMISSYYFPWTIRNSDSTDLIYFNGVNDNDKE